MNQAKRGGRNETLLSLSLAPPPLTFSLSPTFTSATYRLNINICSFERKRKSSLNSIKHHFYSTVVKSASRAPSSFPTAKSFGLRNFPLYFCPSPQGLRLNTVRFFAGKPCMTQLFNGIRASAGNWRFSISITPTHFDGNDKDDAVKGLVQDI